MSRRKTKPEEIRNPEHYFKKYIAMETKHDQQVTEDYRKLFVSMDAILEGGDEGISRDILLKLSINENGELFEETQNPKTATAWILQMQNRSLRRAMESLSAKQQEVLFIRYYQKKSQKAAADILGVSQQTVSKHEKRAINLLKKILIGGCKKR